MGPGGMSAPGRSPGILVVMGVSGSGKSTVAESLAARLGWAFVDGDSFHSPSTWPRCGRGTPLDDDDRAPWLAAIGAWIDTQLQKREPGVVVCSALRRAYRDALVRGRDNGADRLSRGRARPDRGPPRDAPGPLHARRPPRHAVRDPGAAGPEENAIRVGIDAAPADIAATIVARLDWKTGAEAPPQLPMTQGLP